MKYKWINRVIILLLLVIFTAGFFHEIWWWFFTGLLTGYLFFLLIVSTNIRFNYFVNSYNHYPYFPEKKVALSFDDGPVQNTLEILDILKKYKVKAVFFCIGKNVEKNPEILKRIIEEGHIVGNHTFSHTRKMGFLSTSKIIKEIEACNEVVENLTGLKINLFRPPFGVINPKTKRALEKTNHKVIGWNVRSYDAILNSEKLILKRIKKKLKPGDVILLHDSNLQTAEILEQLLIFLETNNYGTVRVDNLFKLNAYS